MPYVSIETNNTIANVLDNINLNQRGGIFLPYIQRDFVWSEQRIYSLLDSLMRDYPMGTILIWETEKPLNYRRFEKDYNSSEDEEYDFLISDDGLTRQYVLDGQQRLQSLYIAMNGTYNDKILFFNLLSDNGYEFQFMPEDFTDDYWLNVSEFLSRSNAPNFNIIDELTSQGVIPPIVADADKNKILNNASALYNIFKNFHNIPIQKLTNDIPLKDIAEIFIRINSGGVVLDAANLIMATIASEWTGANQAFNDLVNIIGNMGFKKPKQFILQSCFTILLGTPGMSAAALKTFSQSDIQNALKQNFPEISAAISDVLTFVKDVSDASKLSTFNIPFYNPILILVAYRYYHGANDWEKKKKSGDARAFLFTAFLCRDFTRPTQKLMKELLAYVSNKNTGLSMDRIKRICADNNKDFTVNLEALLETRINSKIASIIMYLVYNGQQDYDADAMTIRDHIFPRSKLIKHTYRGRKIYKVAEYDSILNCELLTEDKNSKKSDELPKDYFKRLELADAEQAQLKNFLELHAIPGQYSQGKIDLWDIENYRDFLAERKKIMISRMEKNLKGLISPPSPVTDKFRNFFKKFK